MDAGGRTMQEQLSMTAWAGFATVMPAIHRLHVNYAGGRKIGEQRCDMLSRKTI